MGKSLIFPINNKGGVGKTSLLIDLMTMLSTNYGVGLIDTDHQATLFGAATGDYSQGNHDMEFYEDLETKVVELRQGKEFRFAEGSKRMYVGLQPAIAPVALFPVGMMYENPSSREKLENIVTKDMARADVLGVDLPPIPHAGLILDHSITPIARALGNGTELFPLIVATPEKNTVEIGLREYISIKKYLLSKGIPENNIHPIVIMNKVLVNFGDNRVWFQGLDFDDRDKLSDLGITYDPGHKSPDRDVNFVRFNSSFKFEGNTYRVTCMPFIEGLRKGGYCLLKGSNPELFTLPKLYRAVMDSGFTYAFKDTNEVARIYSQEMDRLCSFVKAHSSTKPRKNYSIAKSSRRVDKVYSSLVADIKSGLQDVYEMWGKGQIPDGYFYKVGEISIRSQQANQDATLIIPLRLIPLENLAKAISDTELELGIKKEYIDETWKPGDYNHILAKLTGNIKGNSEYRPPKEYENKLLKVDCNDYMESRVSIDLVLRGFNPVDPVRQSGYFDVFLSNLDRTFKK